MIKFFRKIRQNLLSEGKTGKYLKYAIGEIVLVVIGILIALQINNWNENRKATIVENNLVLTVIAELKSVKKELKGNLNFNQQIQEKMSEYLDDDFPESDKDQRIIILLTAHNNTELKIPSVVSILENNISHSLKNTELLKKLRVLNSLNQNLVKNESFLDEFWNSKSTEFFMRKSYAFSAFDKALRKNIRKSEKYRELHDDIDYKNLISLKYVLHKSWVSDQEEVLKELEEILEYLNK